MGHEGIILPMISIFTLTGLLSGGAGGAVVSAIWNHVSKLLLQRREAEITAKLATLEHEFQSSQKQRQAQIDRSLFVTRAHFETEFESMKDVFACLSEVRLAINAVRPMASLEPAGESEEEKLKRLSDRLKALMTTHDKLLVTSEAKAPFYTEDLYESVETCLRAAVKEALRMDGYVEASQNNETFSEGYIKSVRIIRNRISRLAILPGN